MKHAFIAAVPMCLGSIAFGQIVGPGLVGALADAFGGLRAGFVLSALALALGALAATRQRALMPK